MIYNFLVTFWSCAKKLRHQFVRSKICGSPNITKYITKGKLSTTP